MVAVAVLSFGMVMVYQAFFVSLDTFNYCSHQLEISSWLSSRVWAVQDSITRTGAVEAGGDSGEFYLGNKKFDWSLRQTNLDAAGNLSSVELEVAWKEGKRQVKAARSFYARYEK